MTSNLHPVETGFPRILHSNHLVNDTVPAAASPPDALAILNVSWKRRLLLIFLPIVVVEGQIGH